MNATKMREAGISAFHASSVDYTAVAAKHIQQDNADVIISLVKLRFQ